MSPPKGYVKALIAKRHKKQKRAGAGSKSSAAREQRLQKAVNTWKSGAVAPRRSSAPDKEAVPWSVRVTAAQRRSVPVWQSATGLGGPPPAHIRPGGPPPAHTRPGGPPPAHTRPGGLLPAHTRPGGPLPAHNRPGGPPPAHTRPGGLLPAPSRPGGPPPAHILPGGLLPAHIPPGGLLPAPSRPGGPRPVPTRPDDPRLAPRRPGSPLPGPLAGARLEGSQLLADAGVSVMFAPLPFFDVVAELLSPTVLVRCSGRDQQLPFRLSPAQTRLLASSQFGGDSEQQIQVQLRLCASDGTAVPPTATAVYVNNTPCRLPAAVKSGPGGAPIDITPLCWLGASQFNTLGVTSPASGCWAVVRLVRRRSTNHLLQQLQRRTALSAASTRRLVQEKLGDGGEDGIATTSLKCSLQCPLGRCRMQLPCRATTCQHLQCFDAASYVSMNERKPTWVCPVCDRPALYGNLTIDSYFSEVLKQTDSSCREVTLHQDGSWQRASDEDKENQHREAVADVQTLDLEDTLDLDDDICTDEARPPSPVKRRPCLVEVPDGDERVAPSVRSPRLNSSHADVAARICAQLDAGAPSTVSDRLPKETTCTLVDRDNTNRLAKSDAGLWTQTTLPSMPCITVKSDGGLRANLRADLLRWREGSAAPATEAAGPARPARPPPPPLCEPEVITLD